MDWDDLRVFLAVARAGTVSEASRALEIDHSTVSRRLANLEARIGIRLFDRAGRRLRINAAGEQLMRTAERLESGLLSEKPSVGQRHVYLNPKRAAEIHKLIDTGALPAGMRLPSK